MRHVIVAASSLILFVMAAFGCSSDTDKPLFPSATSSGMSGSDDAGTDGDAQADADVDAGIDAAPLTCVPDMGDTACDKCVFAMCCEQALACSAGTPCDALWTCARMAGCLDPQASDFDTCVVAACPAEATEPAVAAIEALATCIRTSCDATCGG
ncbi:MAG: hypothetical protein IPM54_28830 [Polyangiaceae bacterium]|nr:hypothetical protein [Polyangiaceae bacterium]